MIMEQKITILMLGNRKVAFRLEIKTSNISNMSRSVKIPVKNGSLTYQIWCFHAERVLLIRFTENRPRAILLILPSFRIISSQIQSQGSLNSFSPTVLIWGCMYYVLCTMYIIRCTMYMYNVHVYMQAGNMKFSHV